MFFALKVPGYEEPSFVRISSNNFMFKTIVSTFWQSFTKSKGRMKSEKANSVILVNLGFWGFLPLLGPWGRIASLSQKLVKKKQGNACYNTAMKLLD